MTWVVRISVIQERKTMSTFDEVCVSIVGFNSLVREGICKILDKCEFTCTRFFKDCDAVLSDSDVPAVGLTVFDMGTCGDLLECLPAMKERHPHMRAVLLADEFEFGQMVEAFQLGAHAFLLKEIGAEPLIESLRLVNQGEKVLPSALLQHLPQKQAIAEGKAEVQVQLSELLSDREIDTLRCLVMGYPNKVIAYRLDISEATVKVHVKAILRKLMVQNRTQAAIWAVNQGLITHGGEFRETPDFVPVEEISRAPVPLALAR
ncbi:MAG: DNA-binding response regulator [Novosphingobium pentaromativorans]|uniref:DNA-binding response regulator n=1 Tax=Novosphingobium pentaromativorans TaxID=205844 RepID=A0A2W5QCX6_9SPHN|nr:MAG: DNA-binding response regulator [Novosphingobium pentaromativorans]